MISTLKAYGIEASNSIQIVDKFNEVSNNFSISASGIGEALQRSASALSAAGNDIDESIALVVAANEVVQDPDVVGTALKTMSMRLRKTKTELEQLGEDTTGAAESTSKLREELMALSGVDIMLNADTYKSTTQVIREMADAWQDMTDIQQAGALGLMGGARQGNALAGLISNFETAEEVISTSLNSQGSAMAENQKVVESLAGQWKF